MSLLQASHHANSQENISRSVTIRRVLDCTGCGVAADYVDYSNRKTALAQFSSSAQCELVDLTKGYSRPLLSAMLPDCDRECSSLTEVVLFTDERLNSAVLRAFRWIAEAGHLQPVKCTVVVNSLDRHLNPKKIADGVKKPLHDNLLPLVADLTILRTGFVMSPSSRTTLWTRRLRGMQSLFLSRWTSTFVSSESLFNTIEQELRNESPRFETIDIEAKQVAREITILGERCSWSSVIAASGKGSAAQSRLHLVCHVLSWTGLPWLIYLCMICLGKLSPRLRQYSFQTLAPRSTGELISLYSRHNCRHVQLAGYNNGVNHFGWKFPRKTVVLTTDIPGSVVISEDCHSVVVGAGQTLNRCIRELREANLEFHVVPNYSWISMGTLFFVPVHGSGSRVSTLSDTIQSVLLYDGEQERYFEAQRGDAVFRDAMYNRDRHLLLLRLTLGVKPRSNYFVRQKKIVQPSADDIQAMLADTTASNVEIRKNRAASAEIDVSYYYAANDLGEGVSVEVPRDSIGRVWDRLEETPVVSTLFHWFVRTFAFHVELFLKPDEFSIFWDHHQSLPVSKIQLRRVLKDGMTHSACEHHDCISADLFMTRRNRDVFCQFIATHLPDVRTNPGKQTF